MVWSSFHKYISSYDMDFSHDFGINKLDVSILAGSNVGLNVDLQLKELWDPS